MYCVACIEPRECPCSYMQEGPDSTVNVVLEVNRLRRQLAVSALTWVAAVHDPAVYARGPAPTLQSHPVDAPRETDATVWAWLAKVNDPADETAEHDAEAPLADQASQVVLQDTDAQDASLHGRRVSLVGIVSPRQGQGLVAQSKALSGPVVGSRVGPFGSGGSGAGSAATEGVAIKAPSTAGGSMPVGSLNYDGHFADWARFIDGTLTSPGEEGGLAAAARLDDADQHGEAGVAANGDATSARVKALQAQQVCALGVDYLVFTHCYFSGPTWRPLDSKRCRGGKSAKSRLAQFPCSLQTWLLLPTCQTGRASRPSPCRYALHGVIAWSTVSQNTWSQTLKRALTTLLPGSVAAPAGRGRLRHHRL